ncbi:MAG TPA: DUF2867 domain-containing protein [Actinomycetota bacterium]|nr:DUF2867 domain-containing protein [Actinomycetota bacterium]
MRIAIAGAGGFVGFPLARRLAARSVDVVALGRTREALPSGPHIDKAVVDAADGDALQKALTGCDVAYYLIHSMTGEDFAARDRALASTFAQAAGAAGVPRIVYLGALGRGELSEHLASRQETGRALGSTGIDVVELRAAVIIGAGSISFELMRYLVERLPAMVCPRWVRTRIEPVSFDDVLAHLERAVSVPPGIYELGAGEVLTYQDLMQRYARIRGLKPRAIIHVPLLSLNLSSYWVDVVTPVDKAVSHSLIASLAHEVVAHDRARTRETFGIDPVPLDDAIIAALDEQRRRVAATLLDRPDGLADGVHTLSRRATIPPETTAAVRKDLTTIGGSLRWYGIAAAWQARIWFGSTFGERLTLHKPARVERGADVDWWTIEVVSDDELVLRSREWAFGEAWLGWRVEDGTIRQTAAFRPRGVPGFVYWQVLRAIHHAAFDAMLRTRIRRARAQA